MQDLTARSVHTFHIPVMGTGFTIDTPLKLAKYGISSAISLVDDVLIEQMRKFHCEQEGESYEEITNSDEDARACRITAYLNLVDRLVQKQVEELQASPFEKASEITRYFEMLPETPLKHIYHDMLSMTDSSAKALSQDILRKNIVPGNIDVNIMTKLDRDIYRSNKKLAPEFSDAMTALRGYANSSLSSSIIFSAGINQRLYNYIAKFNDFYPDENGIIKKKIILKVSDFRSAEVQGRFLAKRGLWVSEFRIESGLNCGGHAFATKGLLLGPILEEFKQKKKELLEKLLAIYTKALTARGRRLGHQKDQMLRITVQGGIGTADEDKFLLKHFDIEGTGWATPFLLVPEVINVDSVHLERLAVASDQDVYLSESSPLGVLFWNLRTSMSEEARRARIQEGKPGSSCPKGFARLNTEFTKKPICLASRAYQQKKLQHLPKEGHLPQLFVKIRENILAKSCICHDLAGNATLKVGIDPDATPAVCCGPNIVNFSKIATLKEMVDHIYGRVSLLMNSNRSHMFINELCLYADQLGNQIEKFSLGLLPGTPKYFQEFKENLLKGIEYYQDLSCQFVEEQQKCFLNDLKGLREAIVSISLPANN